MPEVFPAEDITGDGSGLTPYYGPSGLDVREGRYASSFIAPNVSDFGEVISPAVYDQRAFQSDELAMRARGQLEYSQLVNAGATPEEAYRRTAHLLNWNHPDKLAQALARIPGEDTPFTPVMESVDGGRVLRTSPRGAHFIRDIPEPAPKMPASVKAGQDALQRQINATYKQIDADYRTATKPDADPDEKAAAARRVITARERVGALENELQRGSTNWMAKPPTINPMPDAPTQPIATPPPAEVVEVVRTTKDGRKAIFDASTKRFLRYQ